MNFQASNFYIGVIDLFAILLPGAIASLALYHFFHIPIDNFLEMQRDQSFYSGMVLLFSSYLFGHIISQIGSYLDTFFYDRLKDNPNCLDDVKRIRTEKYGWDAEDGRLNNFEWSSFKLQKEHPVAAAEIERYTADSKFFRGLFVILIVLCGVFIIQCSPLTTLTVFLLALFSLHRYYRKRKKATETAYKCIVFLNEMNLEK